MTLRTRLGNLGNILDEAPEQCDHLLLNSPVLTVPEWDALCLYLGDKAAEIDCTFDNDGSEIILYRRLTGFRPRPKKPCGRDANMSC